MTKHLRENLRRKAAIGDLSLFFWRTNNFLAGRMIIYIEDTIGTDDPTFCDESKTSEQKFESKPWTYFQFTVFGILLKVVPEGFTPQQPDYAKLIRPPPFEFTHDTFQSCLYELACLTHTHSDVLSTTAILAYTYRYSTGPSDASTKPRTPTYVSNQFIATISDQAPTPTHRSLTSTTGQTARFCDILSAHH